MKKSNLITLSSFIVLILIVVGILAFRNLPDKKTNAENNGSTESQQQSNSEYTAQSDTTASPTSSVTSETASSTATEPTTQAKPQKKPSSQQTGSVQFNNALFIGDSRTVGLLDYGKIKGANFFANTGMSVYNINKQKIAVPEVGKVTLEELLNNKKYDKIYLMLGINEAGYNVNQTVKKYKELVDYLLQKEPNSKIIIQANLHVTTEHSNKNKYGITNSNINAINTGIKSFADGHRVFYIDVNPVFDDSTGGLDKKKTGDNAHLYGKYYAEWSRWILENTKNI